MYTFPTSAHFLRSAKVLDDSTPTSMSSPTVEARLGSDYASFPASNEIFLLFIVSSSSCTILTSLRSDPPHLLRRIRVLLASVLHNQRVIRVLTMPQRLQRTSGNQGTARTCASTFGGIVVEKDKCALQASRSRQLLLVRRRRSLLSQKRLQSN